MGSKTCGASVIAAVGGEIASVSIGAGLGAGAVHAPSNILMLSSTVKTRDIIFLF
jgi:hypothetical protein